MEFTNIVNLYISDPNSLEEYTFYVNQGDLLSRNILAKIFLPLEEGNCPEYYIIDKTTYVCYKYINSNKETVITVPSECNIESTYGDNVVSFLIPDAVISSGGLVYFQLIIFSDTNKKLNTQLYKFCVLNSI